MSRRPPERTLSMLRLKLVSLEAGPDVGGEECPVFSMDKGEADLDSPPGVVLKIFSDMVSSWLSRSVTSFFRCSIAGNNERPPPFSF